MAWGRKSPGGLSRVFTDPVKRYRVGAFLVVQWLRICLPVQGTRFKPWSRKIPHAAEQLSPRSTTTEPAL